MPFSIDAKTYRSPNYSARPSGTDIWAIIVHSCEGNPCGNEQNSSIPWLCNPASGVSCHYYVTREGAIYQLVDDSKQAWHAGESTLNGVKYCNGYSIGIELEHRDNCAMYPQIQIDALTWLCQQLIARHAIPRSGIATHRQVATPAGRKSDPTDIDDATFSFWASSLYALPGAGIYAVRHTQAILEAPEPDGKVALNDTAELLEGSQVDIDEVAHGGWAHLRSGVGFVPVSVLTRVQ
jgi:hypothetical protein